MAREILTNCEVKLGGVEISNYCKSVALNDEIEQIDTTCFGDTSRTYAAGFKKWVGSINGITDLAIIEPLLNSIRISTVPYSAVLSVLPKKGVAKSATHPQFTGTVQFTTLPIFNAEVANPPALSLNFNGSGTLTRTVTP